MKKILGGTYVGARRLTSATGLKNAFIASILGWVCVACGAAPGDEGGAAEGDVAAANERIEGGQPESGYPAVGYLQTGGGGFCTAELLSESVVLSAAHCRSASMTFNVGTNSSNFVSYPTDANAVLFGHDLMLMHLASPVPNVPPLTINTGAYPANNTDCTAVGFGRYHPDPNSSSYTKGNKRSAISRMYSVTNTSDPRLLTRWITGLPNSGDSGGPLLCNGLVAGVLSSTTDWPNLSPTGGNGSYTVVNPAWIAQGMSIAPPTVSGSLYLTQGPGLYRANGVLGNFTQISDPVAADWSGNSAMVSLNGTIYALQAGYLTSVDPSTGAFAIMGSQDWTGPVSLTVLRGSLYAYQGFGIWKIDNLTTGAHHRVGGIDWTGVTSLIGIDSTNRLYATKNSRLYYVTTGGSAAQLGGADWAGPTSMAVVGSTLYIQQDFAIWQITNLGTGSRTQLGTANWTGATSLTALNDQLYLVQSNHLHRISTADGSYQVLGLADWPGTIVMTAVP